MRFTARPAEELILVILITFEFAEKITFKLTFSTNSNIIKITKINASAGLTVNLIYCSSIDC